MNDFNENIDFEAFLEHIPTLNEEELKILIRRIDEELARREKLRSS